jgi:hypothetical protein
MKRDRGDACGADEPLPPAEQGVREDHRAVRLGHHPGTLDAESSVHVPRSAEREPLRGLFGLPPSEMAGRLLVEPCTACTEVS